MEQGSSSRTHTLRLTLLSLLAACGLFAQTTATIVGTITDESGAAVPDVTVQIKNELTGLVRESKAGSEGGYVANLLPPGTYSVSVSADGFKRFVRAGITLAVGDNATVPVKLLVGAVTETVSVTGAAPLVDTRNASIATVMDGKRLLELPLNGRSPASLLSLIPGVTNVSAGANPIAQAVSVNVAGGRDLGNSFQLDGGQWNNVQYPRGYPLPPTDMVEEFRVESNSYDASKGMASSGSVEANTRSGTNELHGTVWEFLRNNHLNTRNFFSATVPFLAQNQYGFGLGGPIRKNKTFFFGSYQGTRIRQAVFNNNAVPATAAEKAGNFSSVTAGIRDPLTNVVFPGGQIPTSRLDAAALKVLNALPSSNTPDGRYEIMRASKEDGDQFMLRGDQLFGSKNRLSARYWFNDGRRYLPQGNVPWAYEQRGVRFQNINVSDVHTFTPNLLNELRVSRSTMFVSRNASDAVFSSAKAIGINLPDSQKLPAPPTITVNGRISASGPLRGDCIQCDHFWDIRDNVSWIRGKHTVKFGGSFMPVLFGPTNVLADQGGFTFSGQFSGTPMADFLLGRPSFFSSTREREDHTSWFLGLYVNDDVRVTRRLTLNLGLRYHYEDPAVQRNGYSSTFVPGFRSTVFPNAPVGMFFVGDAGRPKALFNADRNNFAPRIGIAWDITGDGRTSLRAGYGIFHQSQLNGVAEYLSLNQPHLPTFYLSTVNSFADPLKDYLGGVVPGDPVETFNPKTGAAVFNPPVSMLGAAGLELRNPYVQQFSLSVQRQLVHDFALDVAYVGNISRKLQSAREANPADYAAGATLANREQRRRYSPGSLASVPYFENAANASYNALQVSLTKRFSASYLVSLNYTWSRSLDDTSGFYNLTQNPDNRAADKALSDFHRAHVLNASWVWELPGASVGNKVARHLIGGWQFSGLVRAATGNPMKVISGVDNSLTAVGQDRPNVNGNPVLSSDRSTQERLLRYFNTSVFSANALGTFGNAGRNILIAPGLLSADTSLSKAFRLFEGHSLQFRAEAFNVLNHSNFGAPNVTFNTANFGRILSAGDSRIIQLALKYRF